MLYRAGLVLEGGGMRGIYTAGVLDFFLDKDLEFQNCYGVSAGAAHMCSYISKQRGRALHVGIDYLDDRNYWGPYSLLTTGDLFNVEMCYNVIPNRLWPYDFEAAKRYPGKAYAVVTNIETGNAEYIRLRDMHKDIEAIRASCSLPLISRNVPLNGGLYLDGGIADSVPIQKSILSGNRKNIVVLTKEVGYRRRPTSQLNLIKVKYARYPKVYELMKSRHIAYNNMLDYLDAQTANGQAFVIRPKKDNHIGRIEKDKRKLKALYQTGYEDAAQCYGQMMAYLNKE